MTPEPSIHLSGSSRPGHALLRPAFLLVLGLSCPVAFGESLIKCWTNQEGIRECGHQIPPEFSQDEHITLNPKGVQVGHSEKATTLEVYRDIELKRRALAKEEIEEKSRRRRDEVLSRLYSSPEDLIAERDENLGIIKVRVQSAENAMERLEHQKATYLEAYEKARFENDTARSSQFLVYLATTEEDMSRQLKFLQEKREEMKSIEIKYDRDLKRFIELRKNKAESEAKDDSAP